MYRKPITCSCLVCGGTFYAFQSEINRGQGKFCSRLCAHESLRRDADVRFWSKIDQSGDCWEWQGPIKSAEKGRNYGSACYLGKKGRAHRIAYMLAIGAIPEGMHVLHRCDNPRCCRPDHLFLGSHAENMGDKIRKGRYKVHDGTAA